MPRLKRVDSAGPGITRRRRGRGWEYLDEDGRKVDDPEVVDRIQALAIPPAWEDVWISRLADGSHPGHRHRRRRAQAVPLPRPAGASAATPRSSTR